MLGRNTSQYGSGTLTESEHVTAFPKDAHVNLDYSKWYTLSGQGLSQVKRRGFTGYVIIDLVNKTTKIQVADNVGSDYTLP